MTVPSNAPDQDREAVYARAGFTGGFSLGTRPALLVVDLIRGFTDPRSPLGSDADAVVERTAALLEQARSRDVFVVFTTIAYDPGALTATAWVRKVPSLGVLEVGSGWVEVDPRLGRRSEEVVVSKGGASAFFGTPLNAMLAARRIDTVVALGATTSGCVRASVVDSVQCGYDTFVVTDCCSDRAAGPHDANLFDMTAKYADAVTAEEVMAYFEDLSQ